MTSEQGPQRIVVGVGAVIWNAHGQVLMVRRANPPRQHEWSLPGGKVEFGEPLHAALVREIHEETGLHVEILGLLDVAELIPENRATDVHYVLVDFSARASGEPVAGSDASEARWFARDEIVVLPLWSETRRVIDLSANVLKIALTDR
jgi:8-oxo-dGTP diphosphatase